MAPVKTTKVGILLALWLLIAVIAVAAGALHQVFPPAVLMALSALAILSFLAIPPLRAWVFTADLRLLLLPHLYRFVGIAFLFLVAHGQLGEPFRAIGWGDALAALGAMALLLLGRPQLGPGRRPAWLLWNCFGATDIALLLVTAVRAASSAPEKFQLFRNLPFGLLPAYVVPQLVATHVFIFLRLFSKNEPSPARARV